MICLTATYLDVQLYYFGVHLVVRHEGHRTGFSQADVHLVDSSLHVRGGVCLVHVLDSQQRVLQTQILNHQRQQEDFSRPHDLFLDVVDQLDEAVLVQAR